MYASGWLVSNIYPMQPIHCRTQPNRTKSTQKHHFTMRHSSECCSTETHSMFLLRAIRSNKRGAVRRRWNRLMYFNHTMSYIQVRYNDTCDAALICHLPAFYISLFFCPFVWQSLFWLEQKGRAKIKHFKCTTIIDGWCHAYFNCSGVLFFSFRWERIRETTSFL